MTFMDISWNIFIFILGAPLQTAKYEPAKCERYLCRFHMFCYRWSFP